MRYRYASSTIIWARSYSEPAASIRFCCLAVSRFSVGRVSISKTEKEGKGRTAATISEAGRPKIDGADVGGDVCRAYAASDWARVDFRTDRSHRCGSDGPRALLRRRGVRRSVGDEERWRHVGSGIRSRGLVFDWRA